MDRVQRRLSESKRNKMTVGWRKGQKRMRSEVLKAVKMEAASFSETLVRTYKSTRRQNSEDYHLNEKLHNLYSSPNIDN